jgi:hypothetical protein
MGKERIIPVIAICILLLGAGSTAYVYIKQIDASYITINNQEYIIDQLFMLAEPRMFDDLDFSGIALDDLILKTGIGFPETHEYTITASDGYQKTVTWENMQNGLLTSEGMTVFSDLPKAFRVKNVISIEVK